jgi:hypothetical protein
MPEIEVLRNNFEERVAEIIQGGFPREVAEQLAAEGLGFPDVVFFKQYVSDLKETY